MERDGERIQEVIERFWRGESVDTKCDGSAEVLAILETCQFSELALELALLAVERYGFYVIFYLDNILSQIG